MRRVRFSIVRASIDQVEAIVHLMVRCVKEICEPDHANDPRLLNAFLHDKTPKHVKQFIEDKHNYAFTALEYAEKVIGFSMMDSKGTIRLNYVHPEYLRKGIGQRLFKKIYKVALDLQLTELKTKSTLTGIAFYLKNGFVLDTSYDSIRLEEGIPLIKSL